MDGLNFDPYAGQKVRVRGWPGVFRIDKVYQPNEEHPNPNLRTEEGLQGTVDLKREEDGFEKPSTPWYRLNYVDETDPVRHAIEWLKTNPEGRVFPAYIDNYEVTAGDDHAGNPAIFVRFFVDQDYFYENGRASEEKIDALNAFLYEVQQILLGLGLDRWTYVRAAEARRVLDVAS
ncbi:MAG: hypothetical protein ABSC47_11570 [Terracidiphilus sp.]|jgi:hypothetical protein